jgi:hypothetical protein
MEMQRFLGCVIGEHVSSEKPWTSIKKEHVEANLISENEKSEMFAVKEPLMVSYNDKDSCLFCTSKFVFYFSQF